jgi:competence protein ComEC
MRQSIGIAIILVFFASGGLGYSFRMPDAQRKHFSRHFLYDDEIAVKVIDIDKDTTGYRKMIVHVEAVLSKQKTIPTVGKLLCYISSSDVETGDQLLLHPKISSIENKNNPGEFDAVSYWRSQGIGHISFIRPDQFEVLHHGSFADQFWMRIRGYLRGVIVDYLSPENIGVAEALVLGDKSGLSSETRAQFANAGAMHVLAVSGMHVGILLGFLRFVFYRIPWMRKRGLFVWFSLIIVWCFAFVTGLSSSVFRATLMFTVLSIGQLRGYSFFSLNALFVSALIILFIEPRELYSIGFQLSFLAMLGISFFFGPLRNLLKSQSKIVNYFWDGLTVGVAAQIGTLPISLYYFNQFPNYFLLTNLGLLVLAGASLIAALLLLSFFWIPYLNDLLGILADFVFTVLNAFISFINELPGTITNGFTPSVIWVCATYAGIISVIYFWNKRALNGFRFTLLFLIVCVVFLTIKRYENSMSREIVFFNNTHKIVLFKEPQKVVCFYDEEIDTSQIYFYTQAYGKRKGVETIHLPVQKGMESNVENYFQLSATKNEWIIDYYGEKLIFRNVQRGSRRDGGFELMAEERNHELTTVDGAIVLHPRLK